MSTANAVLSAPAWVSDDALWLASEDVAECRHDEELTEAELWAYGQARYDRHYASFLETWRQARLNSYPDPIV